MRVRLHARATTTPRTRALGSCQGPRKRCCRAATRAPGASAAGPDATVSKSDLPKERPGC